MSKPRRTNLKYLRADPAGNRNRVAAGFCRCPACGATYDTAYDAPCPHLVTDWCFTAEVEPGEPRGFWAGEGEGELVAEFEAAVSKLEELLFGDDWPDGRSRKAVQDLLPVHLRPRTGRFRSIPWDDLLAQRIAAAPGYLGTHSVQTDSMASDEWDVHWAQNGRAAASHVEALIRADLATVRAVIERAKAILRGA